MIRILAFNAVCFAIPFGLYALWRRMRGVPPGTPWPLMVMARLAGAGILVMLIGLLTVMSFSGGDPGAVYHPPELRDGVVVPGRFE